MLSPDIIIYPSKNKYLITKDTTFYVDVDGDDTNGNGTEGNPWATLSKALDYLSDKALLSSTIISMGDGTYNLTSSINCTHKDGINLSIQGRNRYTKSISSVYSVSGSSGAYYVTVAISNVTNIAIDDYVIIHTASGGTNPTYICGFHRVTAVDSVNNRITFYSKHNHRSANPSGSVVATCEVIKTILSCTDCSCLYAYSCLGNPLNNFGFYQLGIVGNSVSTCADGFNAPVGSSNVRISYCGATGFTRGFSSFHGYMFCRNYCAASGNTYGFRPWAAKMDCASATCIASGGDRGFYAEFGGSNLNASQAISTGNAYGAYAIYNSTLQAYLMTITGASTYAFASYNRSYINASSAILSNNASSYTPSANAQGNEYAYIDT